MKKIYRIQNDDYVHAKTGKPLPRIEYFDQDRFPKGTVILRKDAEDASLAELTQLCDQAAENSNDHAFCGTHAALGRMLKNEAGAKLATKIMLSIALVGGLQKL